MPILLFFFFIFYLSFGNLYSKDEYFLTLRNEKVNLRQGPSFDYPIKLFYKKKFLPLLVQDTSDNFRKVRDHENNSGWVHISQLSKRKAAIVIEEELILFSNSSIFSNPVALLKEGRLVKISKCKIEWCKVKTGKYKGWVSKIVSGDYFEDFFWYFDVQILSKKKYQTAFASGSTIASVSATANETSAISIKTDIAITK